MELTPLNQAGGSAVAYGTAAHRHHVLRRGSPGMIKTNQQFASVLAEKASRENSRSVFRYVRADREVVELEGECGVDGRHILAGIAEQPEYLVSQGAVWHRQAATGAERLFSLDSVTAAHWMRRNLWSELELVERAQREAWAEKVKANEWSNVDVELETGQTVFLPRAGSWLLRFLERCARYNKERRSNEQPEGRF